MTLNIRLKELEQLKNCFKWMGTTSGILSGFTYGAVSISTYDMKEKLFLIKFGYLACTTAVMGLGLITIVISSFCNIFGPGLALRGDKGYSSVDLAVRTMQREFNMCLLFYIAQLFIFLVSLFFKTFLLHNWTIALPLNIIIGVFVLIFALKGYSIFSKLFVGDLDAISGEITAMDSAPII